MATVGHIAVGVAAARLCAEGERPDAKTALLFSALSFAPDLDVIAFSLGIPYSHPFGHRGASHALSVGIVCGLLGMWMWRNRPRPVRMGIIVAAVVASHGILDAFTDGGLGIALLWPFSHTRFFAPWQPIPVAPIGLGMLSPRGLTVLLTELLYFAPILAWALWPPGRKKPAAAMEKPGSEEAHIDIDTVELPVDGVLDLHNFHPRDVKDLVTDYIEECRSRGIVELRIIHGKGKGVLRRNVHAQLERLPQVASFRLADDRSAWGATLVSLHPQDAQSE